MELSTVKEKMIEIATLFYQEREKEALAMFEEVLGYALAIPEFSTLVEPLLQAFEAKDYVLVADIFYHEMAMCIQ